MKRTPKFRIPISEKKVPVICDGLAHLINAYPFSTSDVEEALNRIQATEPEGDSRVRVELFFRAIADTMDAIHKPGQILQRA